MTERQFWMKADQIAESRQPDEEKEEKMAELLKTAYDENLNLMIMTDGEHHSYINLDNLHPNTIGNRGMLCYTSRRKAQADPFLIRFTFGRAGTRDILNNLFNKAVIGRLIFNDYLPTECVVVSKQKLMDHIPGPYPRPENFVDVPVHGYPVIAGGKRP